MFSQNWGIRVGLVTRNIFLGQCVEYWEPFWERNISEHNTIQNTQITTDKCFFPCLWQTCLQYGIEIRRQIDFGQIKVVNELSKNNMARYILSHVMIQQQDNFN